MTVSGAENISTVTLCAYTNLQGKGRLEDGWMRILVLLQNTVTMATKTGAGREKMILIQGMADTVCNINNGSRPGSEGSHYSNKAN